MANRWGNSGNSDRLFFWAPKSLQMVTVDVKLWHLLLMTKLDSILKSRQISLWIKVWFFSRSHVWMWELDYKESWTPKNWCFWTVVLKKTLESPLDSTEIQDWCWSWNSNTLAIWCKEVTHWKRPWCWERLKVGGEGDNTGWDGWMASLTQWTWIWASSWSWWWTGKPGMLHSMQSQSVGYDWVTELN